MGQFFYACAVITQLAIANGEPLFKVEYGLEYHIGWGLRNTGV